jgi:hypothetical protein
MPKKGSDQRGQHDTIYRNLRGSPSHSNQKRSESSRRKFSVLKPNPFEFGAELEMSI